MTTKFALAFELTADPAKVTAGLAETRKQLLQTYSGAKAEVVKLNEALDQAKARAAAMGKALGEAGPPTKAMVADFEKAKAAVNSAAAAVQKNTLALQQTRQAAREAGEAMAAAARAEQAQAASAATQAAIAQAQASARATAAAAQTRNTTIGTSLTALGGRGNAAILADIAEANRSVASLRAAGASANEVARASQLAAARIAQLNAELRGTAAASDRAQGSIASASHRMAAMAASALAVREAIQALKATIDTGVQFDSLKTQYAFGNGGDVRKGADEMAYASELAHRLGLELIGTTQGYAKLQASALGTNLAGQKTRDIFTAVASAGAVMGLSADAQAGALLALSQMMSKGTVQAEELKGQLGERLPGAFQIAAKAMNVTTGELQKMLENGQVVAEDFLPKFAAALQASVNGALPAAERSSRANLQRLENALTEFKLRIANSGLLDKVAEQLERLLDQIGAMADSGELDKLATQFADAFGSAVQFMADAAIVATRFASVIGPLAEGLAALVVGGRALAVIGAAAPGIAATGTAATGAAVGIGALGAAMRLIPGLAVGAALLYATEKLIAWGAAATEARTKSQALEADLRKLIDENNQFASHARLDAEALQAFGDDALAAYEKAIIGARNYAAAKVTQLIQTNKDGRNDEAIAFYRNQAAAYNEYIDTVLAGEKVRREAVALTGQITAKEAEREKLLAGEVKQTRAEAIKEQIKDYGQLVDAIRKAREESQKEAEDAKKNAQSYRDKAADLKTSAADKATQIREKDLTPEQRQANDQQRAIDAQQQGAYYAAAAAAAQLDGRGKAFEQYAKQADKFLERAQKFAESAQDANLVEDIGKQQAGVQEARAKAEDQKAAEATQRAAALMDQLNAAQAKLKELQGEAATIQVNADIASAVSKLAEVETKLAAIKDKTVTVTVNTVNSGATPPPADASGTVVGRAGGGELPGYAPSDTADNMTYRGTPGEWVIQRPTVRYYGRDFMRRLNLRQLPRFAYGGELGATSVANRVSMPSLSASGATSVSGNDEAAVLDMGALGRIRIRKTSNTAEDVTAVLKRHALQFGRN